MSTNNNLHEAKRAKNDEFYTQLTDIEKEVINYKEHFKDKIVLCNCNDALHSNFAKYFSLNFEVLGLKQLICTSYGEDAHVLIYNGDKNGNNVPDLEEWDCRKLDGDGDFRIDEMIDLLKIADIVVTNPPFSLFREYVAQLVGYDKKFLIIGNLNAITYKEIFPLIKENKMWLGENTKGGTRKGNSLTFLNESGDEKDVSSWWYTNIECKRHNTFFDLYKHYNEEEYPKYDNYDAINVNKSCDIPIDYDGVMGVPISFLMFHCPTQFEIVGWSRHNDMNMDGGYWLGGKADATINGKEVYRRILIRKIINHD